MTWLHKEDFLWIICVQEPYFSKKAISQLPKNYGAFWFEKEGTMKRTLIIIPRILNGYMITQHSSGDCVTVRIEKLNLSILSIYCASDKKLSETLEGLRKESAGRRKVICCMDSNAYHTRWGSEMGKKLKWKGRMRGEELVALLDEWNIYVRNEPPHAPTFTRDSGVYNYSHIDVTVCSFSVFNKISKWSVNEETFSSDHHSITCVYDLDKTQVFCEDVNKGIPWKKPSFKMLLVMENALCKTVNGMSKVCNIEQVDKEINRHTQVIQKVLTGVFRKGDKKRKGDRMYWWSEEVNKAYLEMRLARRRMRKYKYQNLKDEFNDRRKEFRRVVRKEKLASWRKFTSDIKDPWEKLIKIIKSTMTGKIQHRTLSDIGGNFAQNMHETLLLLGRQFFPSPSVKLDFHIEIEKEVEELLMEEEAGPKITICEFRKALADMSKSTAPGPDRITNNVVRILATKGKCEKKYLRIFNICLKEAHFPAAWKKAEIVLIPKPHTDTNSVKAFRPISLTSVFSKLFERIILARLLHYLHLSECMSDNQHAYRKGYSTQSALYDLFSFVQKALSKRGGGICYVVFLDISGAFDCTWHYGILHKLLMYRVPRYIVRWMKNFLLDRTACFHEGDNEHVVNLQQGCPQGGVLSPILWNVLFNEMLAIEPDKGNKKTDCLKTVGYADDAAIICKASTTEQAVKMINEHLKKIQEWAGKNRVKFNIGKLASMTISNKVKRPDPIAVYYDNILITEVTTYRYLGLVVDNKLLWNVHIDNVLNKLMLITKSLRGLARGNWGLNLEIYRLLFHAIFMPTMTYGIGIWGWKAISATTCARFDKEIRKYGLMASRCMKSTSNVFVLQLLKTQSFSNILKLEVLKVSIQQFHVTMSDRESVYNTYEKNRIKRIVPQCMDQQFFMYRKGLEGRISNLEYDNMHEYLCVHPSMWVETKVTIHDERRAIKEGADMRGWVIFTDASASSYGIGWSYVVFRQGMCKFTCNGVLSNCTIFLAEAYAILQALYFVNSISGLKKQEIIEIRCDAQGLVRCLGKILHMNFLFCKIKEELRKAYFLGRNVVFRWLPGHRDIKGNEYADQLAKKGVDSRRVQFMKLTKQDVDCIIKQKGKNIEQDIWDKLESRNVKLFLPDVKAANDFLKSSPSSALCQIVSGHVRLNDFLCNKAGVITSDRCACGKGKETISHFLFDCRLYADLREEIWDDFQANYEYITSDWKKLNSYVIRSGRFDKEAREELLQLGENRGI